MHVQATRPCGAGAPALRPLYLRKGEDRRIRRGHPWVFSNEVDVERSPLTGFAPGEAAALCSHTEQVLGSVYVNPHSLICARVMSRGVTDILDLELLRRRLHRALALRERIFDRPFYRLVFGESDGLPGLVADRYGEVLVMQIGTAGMERLREDVIAVLEELLRPRALVLRNDVPSRELEGLERYVTVARGELHEPVPIEENGVRFEAWPLTGQKTGWYFDHRPNRARLARYSRGARVLDLFSYAGAWGVQAAVAGARTVLCVDSSETAMEQTRRNAHLNGVQDLVSVHRGDAFELLKELGADGSRFDVVVVDPPAFIRRRKDLRAGEQAYRRLNRLAAQVVAADGVLLSASCSSHLGRERLLELIWGGVRAAGRGLQILEVGAQGPDHPVHPALPESAYLKSYLTHVFDA